MQVNQLVTGNGSVVPMFVIPFSVENFNSRMFQIYDIPRPVSIERSGLKRQAEFFFGRLAARHALLHLGLAQNEILIGLHREPIWPRDLIGSITHNGEYAAAAVVRKCEFSGIGIDIEAVVSGEMLDALMSLAISQDELHYLRSLEQYMPVAALCTIVFSAKESFYKAAFNDVGRFFDFSAVGVVDIDMRTKAITLVVRETQSNTLTIGVVRHAYFDLVNNVTVRTHCIW